MKRLIGCLLVLAMGLSAAGSEAPLIQSRQMLIKGLQDGNLGLKCDAIFRMAEIKSCYPDLKIPELERALKKAFKHETNPLVKTYAGLTLIYITDPSLCKNIQVVAKENSIDFYQRLQKTLYQNTLAFQSE
jgi:hypothetical protein